MRSASFHCLWSPDEDSASSGPGVATPRPRLEAMEQGIAVRHAGPLFGVPCVVSADVAGLAELMVFYCECAAGFCGDVGYQDDGYFDALVRMFEEALKTISQQPASGRNVLIARLDKVRAVSHNFGYGVGDDMDSLLAKYVGE